MKELPNGLKVFNGTPHIIRFWKEGWDKPVEVAPDFIISAKVNECSLGVREMGDGAEVELVSVGFSQTTEGKLAIEDAKSLGADVIVGSIIAAQAYPGKVVAMVPAPGFERVPPAEKRMLPDKFTVYGMR